MQISFLIVTRNRPEDLIFTLKKLKSIIDISIHEVLVFIDNCTKTEAIINEFDWVNWTISKKTMSASPARNLLYKKAKGTIFIGLDDDAHPVSTDFVLNVEATFLNNKKIGIIAFQEVRGLFKSDEEAITKAKQKDSFLTNDFVGCGFAIKKAVYNMTNGFPKWIDIYGEEPALAIEVLDLNYDILYKHDIIVNHRVDVEKRKVLGRNYFRFEKQLKNTIKYYLVYYPNPILKLLKLLFHNFRKYALKDITYFYLFIKACSSTLLQTFKILKYRKTVKKSTIKHKMSLKNLTY